MLAEQRRIQIVNIVRKDGFKSIHELAKHFMVSEVTIRRDLAYLCQRGLVNKAYGGVISNTFTKFESPYKTRAKTNWKTKLALAEAVIRLINPGDSLLLDVSTTTLAVAQKLKSLKGDLTVITNSFPIIEELLNVESIEVVSCGGSLRRKNLSFVGPSTIEFLESCFVDKLVFSCAGITTEEGLTDPNFLEASLKKKMMQRAKIKIFVGESSKFENKSLASIGSINMLSKIVTDSNLPKVYLAKLKEQGLDVITISVPQEGG